MSRIFGLLLVAVLSLGLAGQALARQGTQTDEELTRNIIGEWFAQDDTGSTVYVFNEDGTWTESGVYFLKDGPREVELSGEWYVERGFLYHSVLKSNLPAKIKVGKFAKIKIKYVSDHEFYMKLSPGKFNPHLSMK